MSTIRFGGRGAYILHSESFAHRPALAAVIGVESEDIIVVFQVGERAKLGHPRRVIAREQPVEHPVLRARAHQAIGRAIRTPIDGAVTEQADPRARVARVGGREPPLHAKRRRGERCQSQAEERDVVVMQHRLNIGNAVASDDPTLSRQALSPRGWRVEREARGGLTRGGLARRLQLQPLPLEHARPLHIGVLALTTRSGASTAHILAKRERGRRRALGELRGRLLGGERLHREARMRTRRQQRRQSSLCEILRITVLVLDAVASRRVEVGDPADEDPEPLELLVTAGKHERRVRESESIDAREARAQK